MNFLEEYEPTKAAREMEQFVDELSNWYIRRKPPPFLERRQKPG
jgi:isoleucyl-tRNA synthetase